MDACHAAVEFESASKAIDTLEAAGITVAKVQLSAALRIPSLDGPALEALKSFDDRIYLHQVVQRDSAGRIERFVDLPQALEAYRPNREVEWRVHYHIPLFSEPRAPLRGTHQDLEQLLERHRSRPISQHLEVETYTWNVLPEELRSGDIARDVASELDWVTRRL